MFADILLDIGAKIAVDEMGNLLRSVERHLQRKSRTKLAAPSAATSAGATRSYTSPLALSLALISTEPGKSLFVTVDLVDKLVTKAQIDHAGAPDLPEHHRLDHVLR